MIIENVKQELRSAIGATKVRDDEVCRVTYAADFVPGIFRKPGLVVFPENSEDVRKVLPIANKYRVPITVLSSGINVASLTVPLENGILLDLRRMNKIIDINTDSGYAVVEPGVTFEDFNAALRLVGYRCQVSTTYPTASVVSHYLSRPSGTLCTRHLDSMIDLEVVFADGTITTTGSSHFPGATPSLRYGPGPDVAGLFCLGHGTMGVVTKASVRIYPKTEGNRLPLATFDSYEASINFVKDLVLNNIAEHCIIYSWRMWLDGNAKGTLQMKEPPKGIPYNAVTVRMAGYEEAMVTNEKIVEKIAIKYGGQVHSREEAAKMMLYYRDLEAWYFDAKPIIVTPATLEKMSPVEVEDMGLYIPWIVMAPPKAVVECEKWAMDKMAQLGCGVPVYYSQPFDYGRSIFLRLFLYPDAQNKDLMQKVMETYAGMYTEALDRYGATPFRARGFGNPWLGDTGEFKGFLKKIKGAVDPNNILNPHMLG